ncbi:DNA polymerase III, beta subunit [Cyclonatronum proteinivorum]|uniref:Beta sliding clamp n=1 Tax=Cyclonatronum proteinivorum TaxID=1457365 RepID=A0A345UIN6_9BACT|nr:DNA polymerase III subunit beta [Cyclonatronum proteinivorum]AXJ00338.1 DNA polymerase III, beta subunit [Cyclonatronum proteinivorum]
MKFNVSSGELVKSLSAVAGAVPAKATMPILEMVLFESEDGKLKLSATDLEVTIVEYVSAEIEEEGSVAVPARRLLDALRALPDIPVSFMIDDRFNVVFKTDKGQYRLAGEDGNEFPETPSLTEAVDIETSTGIIRDAIMKTSFAVSTDDLRPAMMGVYFQIGTEQSKVVATDGHRLVKLTLSELKADYEINFIVPDKALNLTSKSLDELECVVSVTDQHVSFKSGNTQIIARLINQQYPNYETVIPRDNDKNMIVGKDELLATVKRVSIFSSSTSKQIRLRLEADELNIKAEDIDMSSEAEERLAAEYADEPLEIGFNARYLADVISNVNDSEVKFEFSTPNRAGIVKPASQEEGKDILMLVMPVMLNTY